MDTPAHEAACYGVRYRSMEEKGIVAVAAKKVLAHANRLRSRAVPLLVVPFTSEVGRRVQDQAGVSRIDLSANARVMVFGNDDRQEIVADELQPAKEPRLTSIRLESADVGTGGHHSFS